MPPVIGMEKLLSLSAGKRLGKHRHYGRAMFAFSEFGDDDIVLETNGGGDIILSGIYRRQKTNKGTVIYRQPYYTSLNPRTAPQQAHRGKFADAVTAWQILTPEAKAVYNNKVKGKPISGYTLYIKEYLLSH